jgi:YfiH family protein
VTISWIRADWPAADNVVAGTLLHDSRLESLGLSGNPCWLEQVHGASVVHARPFDKPPRADASVSGSAGQICVIRTADCLPVLISAFDGTEVAAAHAGWRGLAAGVIEATVETMRHPPQQLTVWLGPAISQDAFEVSDEVRAAFTSAAAADAVYFRQNSRGRWQADLYGLARRRLETLGVASVSGGEFCTFNETARFCSYRRDPDCGRMVSFVAMRALEK